MIHELFLLDTSAILTLIEDEAGADRVEHVINHQSTLIHAISLLEVYYITQRERNRAEADRRYALLKALPSTIVWTLDEPLLLSAARLKAAHPLSLADVMIAATALHQNAILLHKDPEYEILQGKLRIEALPYKALTSTAGRK